MKKLLVVLLSVLMVLGLTACGAKEEPTVDDKTINTLNKTTNNFFIYVSFFPGILPLLY